MSLIVRWYQKTLVKVMRFSTVTWTQASSPITIQVKIALRIHIKCELLKQEVFVYVGIPLTLLQPRNFVLEQELAG